VGHSELRGVRVGSKEVGMGEVGATIRAVLRGVGCCGALGSSDDRVLLKKVMIGCVQGRGYVLKSDNRCSRDVG
jgi:hypothetical protein